jgi:hypothetical protein
MEEEYNEDIVTFALSNGKELSVNLTKTVYLEEEEEKQLIDFLHRSKHKRAQWYIVNRIRAIMTVPTDRNLFGFFVTHNEQALVDKAIGISIEEDWHIEDILVDVIERLGGAYAGHAESESLFYLGDIAVKRYTEIGIKRNIKQETAKVLARSLLNLISNEYMMYIDPRIKKALLDLEIDVSEIVRPYFQEELKEHRYDIVASSLETIDNFGIDPFSLIPDETTSDDWITFWTGENQVLGKYGQHAFEYIHNNYPEKIPDLFYSMLRDSDGGCESIKELTKPYSKQIPRMSLEEATESDDWDVYQSAVLHIIINEDRTLFLEWLQGLLTDKNPFNVEIEDDTFTPFYVTLFGIRNLFCRDFSSYEEYLEDLLLSNKTCAVTMILVMGDLYENIPILNKTLIKLMFDFYSRLKQVYAGQRNYRALEVLYQKCDERSYYRSESINKNVLERFHHDSELWYKIIHSME